jgi:DNA-binding NtrC family response regulator
MQSHAAPHPVILVVEDNHSFRKSMQQILEDADFLVIPAANADQALALAQSCSGPIDLLLTTLRPGGMLGPDLAYCLRKRSPGMSVLYSTANPMAALEIPDPQEVVASMLPRPFSKTTLLRRVNTLLAEHA